MSSKYSLSICIPTYNRAPYLKDCLSAICAQLDKNPSLLEEVEVIVSDNASTDNTLDVVNSFKNNYKNIKYVSNTTNVGVDKNIINSVLKAEGFYCWLIGDDDFIIKDGINFVVNFLEQNEVSILSVDSRPFLNLEDALESDGTVMSEKVSFSKSHDNFFQKGYCVGILCTMIFDRDLWLGVDRKNYNKGWSYYEIALKMIANSSLPMAHISYPVVVVRQDCAWTEGGEEIFTFMNSNNVTEKMMSFGYDKQRLSKELIKNNKRILVILLRAKGHGLKCDLKNLKLIYKHLKRAGFLRLFLATIIYFIPNKIIVWVRDIKKKSLKK